MSKIIISGVGCCLLDYLYTQIDFGGPVFSKYLSKTDADGGLNPGKLVFTEEFEKFSNKEFEAILDELVGSKNPDTYNIGGPAIVALIHASQLLHNIADVYYYGAMGTDTIGATLMEIIEETPVHISQMKRVDKSSPFTYVFSDPDYNQGQGERTFVNNIGSAWDFITEDIDEHFFQSDIVLLGGTALVPKIHDNLYDILVRAKNSNIITVVNTVYDFRNEKANPGNRWPLGNTDETYRCIDILIMDLEEALRLSGKNDAENACNFFIDQGISSFFITNGSQPVTFYSDGKVFMQTPLTQLPVSEAIIQEMKYNTGLMGDTTGCGDNFTGGILASVAWQIKEREIGKLDMYDACAWGISSGGFACLYVGGTYLEKRDGEKINLVRPYYHSYKNQIKDQL